LEFPVVTSKYHQIHLAMKDLVTLSPNQQSVVDLRGSDLQVIACAGSGKTESISRRVAALIAEGAEPSSIVAFTFTERAAEELKERISHRVAERMGEGFRDRLGPMFVGTIHAYCFRILQDYVPRYGNYDVLDEHRHAGFLSREWHPKRRTSSKEFELPDRARVGMKTTRPITTYRPSEPSHEPLLLATAPSEFAVCRNDIVERKVYANRARLSAQTKLYAGRRIPNEKTSALRRDRLIIGSCYSVLSASTGLIEAARIAGSTEAAITIKISVTAANASTNGSKALT